MIISLFLKFTLDFSWQAFIEEIEEKGGKVDKNIIGQFGVGFYSSFMVSSKVDVYSRSYEVGSPAYKWSSDGFVIFHLALQSVLVTLHLFFDFSTS